MSQELTITPEFIAGLKELLRTAIFAVIPNIILWATTKEVNYSVMLLSVAIAVLSGLDEWLHKVGKTKEEETGKESVLTTGLSRF